MEIEYPHSYIAWDLETTGLDPRVDKILEIGAARIENGEVKERKSWLLNHGIEIPEGATAIHGITKAMIDAEGRDPKEAMDEFFRFFVVGSTPHLTHNGIRFDIPFLVESASQIYGCTLGKSEDLRARLYSSAIDTAVLVKGRKLEMDRMWNESFKEYADRVMQVMAKGVKYSIATCCEELEIQVDVQQHRALGDIELTHEIYRRLIA